jgi:hypothetical protein
MHTDRFFRLAGIALLVFALMLLAISILLATGVIETLNRAVEQAGSLVPIVFGFIGLCALIVAGAFIMIARRSGDDLAGAATMRELREQARQIQERQPTTTPDPAALARIIEELRRGRKIEAIKLYRRATGVGLKEAKDQVEALDVAR